MDGLESECQGMVVLRATRSVSRRPARSSSVLTTRWRHQKARHPQGAGRQTLAELPCQPPVFPRMDPGLKTREPGK